MPTLGNATLLTPNRATQIAAGTTGTSGATNAALILGLMQTSDFTSNPSLDVGAGAGNQRNIAGSVVVTEGLLIGPTGLSPSSVATSADLVLNAKGTGIVRVGPTGPRVATLNDVPAIPVTSVFGQIGVITAAQGVTAGLAAGIYPSIPLAINTTLSLAVHHNHILNATAAIILTVPTPGVLTDGFWTCFFTDPTHTVTISGTVHDLTGALVTSIPPGTKAEIEVWGGQVYAIMTGILAPTGPTQLNSVVLSGPTTLNPTTHFLHDLYTSASITLTVTNAATLGDGFKTCIYTDTGHTVTISGTVYDLTGNLVTSIPPSSKAEIDVYGGQIYATVSNPGLASNLAHGTASNTINFVGFDAANLDYRFGFDDFVGYGLAAGGVFTKRVATAIVALTDAATIATDASAGNVFKVTLGGARTLGNPTNPPSSSQSQELIYFFVQDGTGSRTLALGSAFSLPSGVTFTLSTGIGAVDMASFVWDGTKWRGNYLKAFS